MAQIRVTAGFTYAVRLHPMSLHMTLPETSGALSREMGLSVALLIARPDRRPNLRIVLHRQPQFRGNASHLSRSRFFFLLSSEPLVL